MKKSLLLSLALLAGCATTSAEGPEPKFKVGECLTLNEAGLKALDPMQALQLSLMQIKVVDLGTTNYVLEIYTLGQLSAKPADTFANVEKEFVVTSCETQKPVTETIN